MWVGDCLGFPASAGILAVTPLYLPLNQGEKEGSARPLRYAKGAFALP